MRTVSGACLRDAYYNVQILSRLSRLYFLPDRVHTVCNIILIDTMESSLHETHDLSLDDMISADLEFLKNPQTHEKIQELKSEDHSADAAALLEEYVESLGGISDRLTQKIEQLKVQKEMSHNTEELDEEIEKLIDARNRVMKLTEEAEMDRIQLVSSIGTPEDITYDI